MDVKPSSGHVAPTAPARIIEALRLDGPGGRGPLEGPSGTDADARKPRKVIGVGLGSFPAKTPETLAAPLPAVKQWCPDLDNRSGAVMTTLWCPEAERTQTTATVKTVPGLGSPFGAAAWIPEQQTPSLPPRHQSRTAEAMHRRGISPGRDRDSPQARISITVQSAEAIHATRPFFSDEGEGPNMQHDRRNDDVFEAATHGGQEILTASTKSKSPNSEDDTWVDSAGRNPRLLSVSLTPASGAGINAQAIHTHIDSKSLNEEANGHVASQAAQKILHCGRGGMGRRRETANCNGRHAKYQVQRSHNCSLCFLSGNQQNAIEFVFAERSPHNTRIQLPEETELNVKAARVEFVLPDGSHLWLWSVRPQTISDIRHAISQVANIHNKVAEMPAANSLQKSNSGHETCDVQLGFVPSGEFARVDDADRGNEKMLMGPASSASPGAQRNKPFVPALRLEQLPPPEPVSRALQRATPHTSSCSESESAQPESCSRDRGERMVHHTYQVNTSLDEHLYQANASVRFVSHRAQRSHYSVCSMTG